MTRFLNGLHDSLANTSLAGVLSPPCSSLCSNFKSLTLTINNLPWSFKWVNKAFSPHTEVSAGSDVCNSIWAPREPNFALWPLDRFCILSSLVRRDAKLQSLNTARPPRHMSAVTSVLSRHAMRTTDTSHKWCPWLMLLFLDSPPPHTFLPVMLKRTSLWLSIDRRHLLLLSFPFTIIPLNLHPQPYIFLSLSYHCCMCCHAARQQ